MAKFGTDVSPHLGKKFGAGQDNKKGGRPKKGMSLIVAQLNEKGYPPVKSSEIKEIILSFLQLTESELLAFSNDASQPILVRILATGLLSNKAFDFVEKMLDRTIGKPSQHIQVVEEDLTSIEFQIASNLSDETLRAYIEEAEQNKTRKLLNNG
jgi:hypothetical protein